MYSLSAVVTFTKFVPVVLVLAKLIPAKNSSIFSRIVDVLKL